MPRRRAPVTGALTIVALRRARISSPFRKGEQIPIDVVQEQLSFKGARHMMLRPYHFCLNHFIKPLPGSLCRYNPGKDVRLKPKCSLVRSLAHNYGLSYMRVTAMNLSRAGSSVKLKHATYSTHHINSLLSSRSRSSTTTYKI